MGSTKLIKPLFYGCLFIISIGLFKTAGAQEYPNRSIKLIVPFTPGGTTDAVARMLARQLEAQMGQTIVVENKPGAGGNIGTELVAKSNPNGHTLLIGTVGTLTINPYLYKNISYDAHKELEPITFLASTPNVLVLNKNVPIYDIFTTTSISYMCDYKIRKSKKRI